MIQDIVRVHCFSCIWFVRQPAAHETIMAEMTGNVNAVIIYPGVWHPEGRRMGNMLELNYRDARPIYEQIKDGLRRLVFSNVIRQDEKLPSVRELASQLAINPNTIQKAYRELEQEGFIYTVSGKGSFAAPLSDVQSKRKEELLGQFDKAVTELLYLKKEAEELKQRIDSLQKECMAKMPDVLSSEHAAGADVSQAGADSTQPGRC